MQKLASSWEGTGENEMTQFKLRLLRRISFYQKVSEVELNLTALGCFHKAVVRCYADLYDTVLPSILPSIF